MSLITRLNNMRQNVHIRRDRLAPRRLRDGDEAPIKPIEPLEQTQPEIPKVGTADAPGG